jgi:hypothetical protein
MQLIKLTLVAKLLVYITLTLAKILAILLIGQQAGVQKQPSQLS